MAHSEGERNNDVELVIRAQKGDQQAFEMLYLRYCGQINRYLSHMVGDSNAGCELTQETFLKAWLNLPGLRTPKLFTYWLYRIAHNCARDHQRRQSRFQQIPLDIYTQGGGEEVLSVAGPEEGVEERELIWLAFTQVSLICRSCVILYETEKLSHQEIADRLRIKKTSVSNYIRRGKEQWRQNYYRLLNGQRSVALKGRKGVVDE